MKFPLISIVIATYNSEKTLFRTLDSLKKQSYPRKLIQILIIDGGSNDKTLQIAKKYKCEILLNLKTELVYAKHIGFMKAKGNYLMFLDSDEVLENENSLAIKIRAFQSNRNIRSVLISGYKTPAHYSEINEYINQYGDPFSFFMYRESKGSDYLFNDLLQKYPLVQNEAEFGVFNFFKLKKLPLIELWAGGCMIDLNYCRKMFPQIKNNPDMIAHLFYLLNLKGALVAVTKNDNTIHYSASSIKGYLKKISSRVKNNIFGNLMGKGGFQGRELFHNDNKIIKKILFFPYVFLILPVLIDTLYLTYTKRKLVFLWHFWLSLYTAVIIIYFYLIKLLRISYSVKTYGQ